MRLFLRSGYYYVQFRRTKKQSLRTKNRRQAEKIFNRLKREWLEGRLVQSDPGRRITLAEFISEYLSHRETMAPSTYRMDSLSLRLLRDVVGPTTLLRSITQLKIEDFKSACFARGVKKQSVNSYLRHIKAALGQAVEWDYLKERPRVKFCKAGKTLPRVLSPREIDVLLAEAKKDNEELWRLMVFYLWTGARRSEALRLKGQDVFFDSERPCVRLFGKGEQERLVPLLPPAIESLRPYQKDMGPVFPRREPSTISHWFLALARKCSIKARLHDLRHTAATYMLANGIDIRYVQEILGHAQLSTTQIYTHVLKDKLYDEMLKLKFK
jgi:site-specific recombinase XerD